MKRNLILTIALFLTFTLFGQSNRIPVLRSDSSKVNIFMNGGNLAWDQFANDFGPGATNFDYFDEVFTAFENAGGNAMRLWVHINGANNPELDGNGFTTGLEESHISDMQRVLDLAYNHKTVLVLSLWSFDMLNHRDNPPEVVDQGQKILTVEENIQSYIDNALIPMVEAFKDHPAVGAWEIFNEPEGMSNEFGWSHTKHVPMTVIQRFVNRCAGAIHRTDPDALVTNGTWAMYTNTDILTGNDKYKNYYSDEELVAVGGDADGTLDFYQVHYYDWMSDDISVMHHPADHWQLDKAILVGEFFPLDAKGISWETYYDNLYNNGYAGALAWQWYGENGSTEPYRTNMVDLMESIKDYDDIEIEPDRNRYPFISSIDNGLFYINSGTVNDYVDLDDIASDPDGDELTFSIKSNTNTSLVDVSINATNGVDLTFTLEMTGSATIVIQAKDPEGLTAIVEFNIVVRQIGTGNLALFRTTVTTAHDEEGTSTADPLYATDGDYHTRWSSAYRDPAWYAIDLGAVYEINQITLYWEVAYGQRYEIQVSNDGTDWATVYTENSGDGGTDEIIFEPVSAQFVRMYGVQRASQWGYSLYEFEVYGAGTADTIPLEGISITPSTLELNPGQTFQLTAEYTPENTTNKNTTWSSDNNSIATVDASGLVSAQSLGYATITATTEDGGYTSTSNITVTDDPIPVRYNLTLEVTGPGSVTISPEGGVYDENTTVTLTAILDSNAVFSGWSGDASDTSTVIEVIMDGDKTIKATFTTPIAPPHCNTFTPINIPFEYDGSGELCWVTSGTIEYINSWNLDYLIVNGTDITNDYVDKLPAAIDGKYYISYGSSLDYGHIEIEGSDNPTETYTLTVNQATGGTISPESGEFEVGSVVTLTATPDNGYEFDSWTGGASGTESTTTVTMDAPTTVSAIFNEIPVTYFDLTVNTTEGGTVNNTGGTYPLNTEVTITATPNSGYLFDGWSGDITATEKTVTIVIDTNKTILASFNEEPIIYYDVIITTTGNGTVSPNGGSYQAGTEATFTATPDEGWVFIGWSDETVENPKTITVNSDINLVANFEEEGETWELTVNVSGNGSVSPAGGLFSNGTTLTLTATPAIGNEFVEWTGDASGIDLITTIIMDNHKTVTATFQPEDNPCESPLSITIPYSFSGEGEYCWFTTDNISKINSWNTEIVEINGVDYTNAYSSSVPERIDGGYYINYKGGFAWSHFEAEGSKIKNAKGRNYVDFTDILIYPNPFNENTTIHTSNPERIESIQIIDQSGRVVKAIEKAGINIDTNIGRHLQPGLYLVNIKTSDDVKVYIITKQ